MMEITVQVKFTEKSRLVGHWSTGCWPVMLAGCIVRPSIGSLKRRSCRRDVLQKKNEEANVDETTKKRE
jgi:hypothetical protein